MVFSCTSRCFDLIKKEDLSREKNNLLYSVECLLSILLVMVTYSEELYLICMCIAPQWLLIFFDWRINSIGTLSIFSCRATSQDYYVHPYIPMSYVT